MKKKFCGNWQYKSFMRIIKRKYTNDLNKFYIFYMNIFNGIMYKKFINI